MVMDSLGDECVNGGSVDGDGDDNGHDGGGGGDRKNAGMKVTIKKKINIINE